MSEQVIRIGVLGCGGMGKKRIAALQQLEREHAPVKYIGVTDEARYLDYETLDDLLLDKPDWIIVCLPHDVAVPETLRALAAGCKVLIEKPMGRNLTEAELLHNASDGRLFVGMNYRFYPGVIALMADLKAGYFGQVHKVEMILGHGGKPGNEKGWKLNPDRNGGAMLDPGVHLLDLAVQMNPNLELCFHCDEHDIAWKTGIAEESTAWLSDYKSGPTFLLTASIVRWRNTFRIEVHGSDGYGIVERRGGNYGPQSYRRGKRWGWRDSGSHWPEDWVVRQANCETVFADELRELFFPSGKEPHVCTSAEALETMKLYDRLATIGQCNERSGSQ